MIRIKETILNNIILLKNKRSSWAFILTIFLFIFFIILEIKYPYYFLHDDNRLYWLPAFVFNYESIQSGILPIFNFHQYLGYPWLSNGQTMVLYPFGYVTTLISKVLFGNYFATIDIFIILHLVMGALAFFVLLKFMGLRDKSSVFGAITWILNSFIIYASTGWIFISVHAVFFPLIIYFSLKLLKKFNYKTFIFLVICRLLLFLAGHPQYFIYSIIFEILTIMLTLAFKNLKQEKSELFKTLKVYIYSYICTTVLALPLLLPMVHQMNISAIRNAKLSFVEFSSSMYNIKQWFSGFIYPFNSSTDYGILFVLKYSSYVGYLTIFFFIVCIIKYFRREHAKTRRIQASVLLILGAIAFLWMTSSLFNHIIYLIPILNRFRWPFKLEFYVNFYLVIIASIGFNSYLNQINKSYKKRIQNIIFMTLILVHIIDFSYLYVFCPQRGFDIFQNKGLLNEPLSDKITKGRIVSFKDYYSSSSMSAPDYIGANFASMWELYHIGGYEPLISEENGRKSLYLDENSIMYLYKALWTSNQINELINHFREWGVKWYIVNKESTLKEKLPFKKFYEDDKRTVYLDKQAKPFFYWGKSENYNGINSNIKTNIIELNINSDKQDHLIVNFLYNPFFKAYLDNKEITIKRNPIGKMMLLVPKGEHNIVIKYSDPYFEVGLYISIFSILLAVIYFIRLKIRNSKVPICELKIPNDSSSILLFIPHPDDEIAGCYSIIKKAKQNGCSLKVVMVTNGDGVGLFDIIRYKIFRFKPEYFETLAYIRQKEVIEALTSIGLKKTDIIFLGYPDGCLMHLWKESWNKTNPFISKYTKKNYPFYKNSFNQKAFYAGSSLAEDIETIILEYKPTHIVYPNAYDRHKDHIAVNNFVKYVIFKLDIRPTEFTYLMHRGMWPVPVGKFTKRQLLPPKSLNGCGMIWYYIRLSNDEIKEKERCLLVYKSQLKNPAMKLFLNSFIRQNELFAEGSDWNLEGEYDELFNINSDSYL